MSMRIDTGDWEQGIGASTASNDVFESFRAQRSAAMSKSWTEKAKAKEKQTGTE